MFAVALLTTALVALANARIYERCELARDLLSLGVRKEHLATWVCIAFHESRFDTAARNPYSGDHGLFQISELYWCGAGKACGLPCSALRDEDISDDFECALQVHEEHTRLQGNGFLAWVVYPQHCKHNTKKYLADCESSVKTPLVRTYEGARVLKSQNRNVTAFSYNPKIDELLPPYLTIGSFLRGSYEKEFEQNYNKDIKIDWLNYKIDNIDDLKLPVFNQKVSDAYPKEYTKTISPPKPISTPSSNIISPSFRETISPTYTTTTTTDSPLPNIKPPSPRRIESNSFRRKKLRPIEDSIKFTETTQYPLDRSLILTTVAPNNIYKSTTEHTLMQDNSLKSPITTVIPITTPTNINKYSSADHELSSPITLAQSSAVTKSPLDNFTISESIVDQNASTKSTGGLPVTTPRINQKTTMALRNHSLSINKTRLNSESFADSKRNMPVHRTRADEATPTLSSSSVTPFLITKKFYDVERTTSQSTTMKPWSKSWLTWRETPFYKSTITSTTSAPSSTSWTTSKSIWRTTPISKSTITSTTYKPRSISWSTAKSFFNSNSLDKTTNTLTTSKPPQISWNTAKPWASITPFHQTTFTTTIKPFLSWRATKASSSTTLSYITSTTSKPPPISLSTANSLASVIPSSQGNFTSTTSRPTSMTLRTVKSWSSTEKQTKISTSRQRNQPITSTSWTTRVWPNRNSLSTASPRTELQGSNNNSSSTKPLLIASTTKMPTVIPKSKTRAVTSTEIPFPTTARTTQSIFDLYLNPTKRPNITALSVPLFKNRGFSFRIFAGGTTTHAPNFLRSKAPKIASEEIVRNKN